MSVNAVNADGSLTRIAGGSIYSFAPIGAIVPYAGSKIPEGYLLCDGREISRTEYAGLFAVIGTAYGTGDGSTTFNIPDLREATTKGVGLSGKSSNHYDSDGVALGEFVEDRIKNFQFNDTQNGASTTGFGIAYTSEYLRKNSQSLSTISNANTGATTEVKAVGVNYIIKAKDVAMIGGTQTLADKVSDLESNVTELQEKGNNNFSTTPTEILTSASTYTVTEDVVLVKAVLATTETQYSGAEFVINGISVAAVGANSANSAVSQQNTFKCYKGDVLSKNVNTVGGATAGSCRVYVFKHA